MTYVSLNTRAAHRLPAVSGLKLSVFRRAYDVWQQRQALRDLSDRSLEDIGITREEALREARRPFWDFS